jgi:small subunit ribosomal protein S7e
VYPTEIVGKRTRVDREGHKLMKVHLNPKDQVQVEGKLDTFAEVYKTLCSKDVEFVFPETR